MGADEIEKRASRLADQSRLITEVIQRMNAVSEQLDPRHTDQHNLSILVAGLLEFAAWLDDAAAEVKDELTLIEHERRALVNGLS